ncbi:hypothetical protein H0H87_007270 [Tephrocybe sp. NHM501043]|nr:hypothetical protein H0H87_007270 [Tephrocybe sp. NHM501043]
MSMRVIPEILIERYLCYQLKCQAQNGDTTIRDFVARALRKTNNYPVAPPNFRPNRVVAIGAIYLIDILVVKKKIRSPKHPCVLFTLALMISQKINSDPEFLVTTSVYADLVSSMISRDDFFDWERSIYQDLDYNLSVLATPNLRKYESHWVAFFTAQGPGAEATEHLTGPDMRASQYNQPNPYPGAYPAAHALWYTHPNYPKLPDYSSWPQYHNAYCPGHSAPPNSMVYLPRREQLWTHFFNAEYYYPTWRQA